MPSPADDGEEAMDAATKALSDLNKANAATTISDQVLEIVEFFRFGLKPKEETSYRGRVNFHLNNPNIQIRTAIRPDGKILAVAISEDDEDANVSDSDGSTREELLSQIESTPGQSIDVTMDAPHFVEVYNGVSMSRLSSLILSGYISVSGWRYSSLKQFAYSFDFSTEKWNAFYKWRRKRDEERAARQQLLLQQQEEETEREREQEENDKMAANENEKEMEAAVTAVEGGNIIGGSDLSQQQGSQDLPALMNNTNTVQCLMSLSTFGSTGLLKSPAHLIAAVAETGYSLELEQVNLLLSGCSYNNAGISPHMSIPEDLFPTLEFSHDDYLYEEQADADEEECTMQHPPPPPALPGESAAVAELKSKNAALEEEVRRLKQQLSLLENTERGHPQGEEDDDVIKSEITESSGTEEEEMVAGDLGHMHTGTSDSMERESDEDETRAFLAEPHPHNDNEQSESNEDESWSMPPAFSSLPCRPEYTLPFLPSPHPGETSAPEISHLFSILQVDPSAIASTAAEGQHTIEPVKPPPAASLISNLSCLVNNLSHMNNLTGKWREQSGIQWKWMNNINENTVSMGKDSDHQETLEKTNSMLQSTVSCPDFSDIDLAVGIYHSNTKSANDIVNADDLFYQGIRQEFFLNSDLGRALQYSNRKLENKFKLRQKWQQFKEDYRKHNGLDGHKDHINSELDEGGGGEEEGDRIGNNEEGASSKSSQKTLEDDLQIALTQLQGKISDFSKAESKAAARIHQRDLRASVHNRDDSQGQVSMAESAFEVGVGFDSDDFFEQSRRWLCDPSASDAIRIGPQLTKGIKWSIQNITRTKAHIDPNKKSDKTKANEKSDATRKGGPETVSSANSTAFELPPGVFDTSTEPPMSTSQTETN